MVQPVTQVLQVALGQRDLPALVELDNRVTLEQLARPAVQVSQEQQELQVWSAIQVRRDKEDVRGLLVNRDLQVTSE